MWKRNDSGKSLTSFMDRARQRQRYLSVWLKCAQSWHLNDRRTEAWQQKAPQTIISQRWALGSPLGPATCRAMLLHVLPTTCRLFARPLQRLRRSGVMREHGLNLAARWEAAAPCQAQPHKANPSSNTQHSTVNDSPFVDQFWGRHRKPFGPPVGSTCCSVLQKLLRMLLKLAEAKCRGSTKT